MLSGAGPSSPLGGRANGSAARIKNGEEKVGCEGREGTLEAEPCRAGGGTGRANAENGIQRVNKECGGPKRRRLATVIVLIVVTEA